MGANSSASIARWSRAFVAAGIAFFLAWHLAVLAGYPRAATVPLGLYGFVFHVVFGKGYQLIPSYFARELAVPVAPKLHLPLAAAGVTGSFVSGADLTPVSDIVGVLGATCWLLGCLVFVGSLGWTVRGNVTGQETGTGGTDSHRTSIDRAGNAVVPVVALYLLGGSSLPVLEHVGVDVPIAPGGPATTHVLAAGTATLLVFAIGFRLLPRLLVATPRPGLVGIVLPAGAIAPALLAIDFRGGLVFRLGAAGLALAVVGFAVSYADLYRQSERRRVGGWTILAGVAAGVLTVALGLSFATGWLSFADDSAAYDAHYRLAVGGFLGLTIVGVSYHFYPPAVSSRRFVDERSAAAASIALLVGVGLDATGSLAGVPSLVGPGRAIAALGAILYAIVIGAVFLERPV